MDEQLQRAQDLAVAGKPLEAAAIYEGLLADGAGFLSDVYYNLASCYSKARQPAKALAAAEAACALAPQLVRNWLARNYMENKLGLGDAALASLYRAFELEPTNPSIQETRLFALYTRTEPLAYRSEMEAWYEATYPRSYPKPTAPTPPLRRIRVGYVSGDFRTHVMDRYIEALLKHHDQEKVEVFCFDSRDEAVMADSVRVRLYGYKARFINISGMSDEEAAEAVRREGIDILVDLSGLTAHNRLGLFVQRPAPIQLTGIGYTGTLGADCFDFRIADYERPEYYTEPLLELPRAAVPLPLFPDLPVTPLPALRNGFVTFGYVNGLHKLTPEMVRQIIEVLEAVPRSKLLLMVLGAADPETARIILRRFDPVQDRVILTESNGGAAFCRLFADIDVALDPAPYGGCTTTIDTLFHGAPIATNLPERRVAADAYVLQREFGLKPSGTLLVDACDLAEDLDKLGAIRSSLRDRYLNHPVGRPDEWVANLEEAYAGLLWGAALAEAA